MSARLRLTIYAALATLASSFCLSAVYSSYDWLAPVAGGIVIVATTKELLRRSPMPSAFGPPLAAVAILFYVTALYADAGAFAGFIPSGESLQTLAQVARDGFSDVRTLSTPVPASQGLLLLAVVGLACVALVVDLLAVVMRRAAVAGLPLLAVFALCTSVAKHGVGALPFVITASGYLALLLADSRDRLERWGKPLGFQSRRGRPTWTDSEVVPSPLSVLGRRIGATAVAVGVVVPLLVPGLHGGLPKRGNGSGAGPGGGSNNVVTVNPIVSIRADLTSAEARPVLHMTSTDSNPGYLRLTSLDRFDGTTFSPSTLIAPSEARVSRGIPAPDVPGSGQSVQTARIRIGPLSVHWLPVPTQVQSVKIDGDWRYDPASNTIFSARSDTKQVSYTVTSTQPEPTAADLRAVGRANRDSFGRYLALPPMPADVVAKAKALTASAASPFDKALAIQRYLTSKAFTYDTSAPLADSTQALRDFLLVSRRGFCQQFASTMAVLARMEGIPSRVAVGFTRGERQKDGGWLVTTHDAHAWPELYFPVYGWLPFEPTPRGDGQAAPPSFTQSVTGDPTTEDPTPQGQEPVPPTSNGKSLSERKDVNAADDGPTTTPPSTGATRGGHGWKLDLVLAALAVLVLLIPTPAVVRALSRRRRWRAASTATEVAHAAWAELRACALDAAVDWPEGLTPRATARVLVGEAGLEPAEQRGLDRLVDAEQRARYAADPAPAQVDALRRDINELAAAFVVDRSPAQRLVLRAWPRSVLLTARALTGRLADLLDAVDLGGARARVWLRRHAPRHA